MKKLITAFVLASMTTFALADPVKINGNVVSNESPFTAYKSNTHLDLPKLVYAEDVAPYQDVVLPAVINDVTYSYSVPGDDNVVCTYRYTVNSDNTVTVKVRDEVSSPNHCQAGQSLVSHKPFYVLVIH